MFESGCTLTSDANNPDLIDILTPSKLVKQCNFSKLSLSQTRKSEVTNTAAPPILNGFLKVKSLSQLISPKKDNDVKPILENNDDNEVFVISSDDDDYKIDVSTIKPRQRNKRKSASTTRKRRNKKVQNDSNEKSNIEETPSKTSKLVQSIKTDIKKITVQRRLTKSTNLKQFSAKYLPSSQQKIDDYFKVKTNNTKLVKYYETFDKSKPETKNITEVIVTDYLEIAMNEMDRIKEDNPGISQVPLGYQGCFENGVSIDLTQNDEGDNDDKQRDYEMKKSEDKESSNKVNCVPQNCAVDGDENQSSTSAELCKVDVPANTPKVPRENLDANHQSSSRRSSLQPKSDSTSLEFCYKSMPSEKTESVDYAPSVINLNPPIRRSKRQSVTERSSVSVTTTETTRTEKVQKTDETVTKSKRAKLEKKSNQIPKQKVRKRLKFPASIDSDYLVPNLSESNPLPSLLNSSSSSIKSAMEFEKVAITEMKPPLNNQNRTKATGTRTTRQRKSISCPDYKIIKGTPFAVDAFRFGYIDGVTHYFLTHFHADHYIGLKKSFTKPIYLSAISARLVSTMIGTEEQYLRILELNETIVVNGIEITALDANHCPGAIMLHFRLTDGKCILHTGDFRASSHMESEPIFWNYSIHTIYLDTTYLSSKYAFKSQDESIDDAVECVRKFREKHIGEKVLIVCGSYVVGKEKIWMAIAEKFHLTVWMDGNRKRTIEAIKSQEMLKYLNNDPLSARIHVLPMNRLSYDYLWQYLNKFTDYFDVLLALRPSGWEKNSKPQYRGRVNIVGIEYSEHSSFDELRRFVRFVQPIEIISTVPNSSDLTKTTKIPKSWFKNDLKTRQIGYQSSITNYMKFRNPTKRNQPSSSSSKNDNSKEEPEEIDGLVLDATRSNITLLTPTKSLLRTPQKFDKEINSPHTTIVTMTTDWMS